MTLLVLIKAICLKSKAAQSVTAEAEGHAVLL